MAEKSATVISGSGAKIDASNANLNVAAGNNGNLNQGTIDRTNLGLQTNTKHIEVNTIEHATITHVHHHYGGDDKSEESTTEARPKRTAEKAHVLSPALPRKKKKAVFNKEGADSTIKDMLAGGNFGDIKHEDSRKTITALKVADNDATFMTTEDGTRNTLTVQTPSGNTSVEDCIQLSDSIWMLQDRRISTHGEIYEGELRSEICAARPIVLKLVEKIPQGITEVKILAKLNHSNILSLIHAGTINFRLVDQIYIALDKCHHENLREFVVNRKNQGFAFNLSRAIEIVEQIVDGMKYIHENRIIHKDIKPGNILFSLDQRLIKIADFGLSQELDSTSTEIFEKGQFGTNGFRSPESFGNGIISQKSDILSLGVTFYFVLSNGEHPFGKDRDSWNHHMLNGIIDLSSLLVPNIKTTEHLIKSMIEHKINDRPTIWQVSEHPFWTGNEVSCDFGYHSPESAVSLIPPTSEEPSYSQFNINQFQEHMKKIQLRDEAVAEKNRERTKDGDADLTTTEAILLDGGTGAKTEINNSIVNIMSGNYGTASSAIGARPERMEEEGVQLSDSIWFFKEGRLAKQAKVFEGVQKRETFGDQTLAIKLIWHYTKKNLREIKNLLKLHPHTHVVGIVQAGVYKEVPGVDCLYIAMERCSTLNLDDYIKERRSKNVPFNPDEAFEHARQVIDAIDHIHQHDILHRDLKPSSILFSLSGRNIKICNFGMSKQLKNGHSDTSLSTLTVGTDGYRAPETYKKDVFLKMADIFSLAFILYHLLSYGFHPFGIVPANWKYYIQNGIGLDLSRLRGPFLKTVKEMLKKMLNFEAKDRIKIDQVKNSDCMKREWFPLLIQSLVPIWNGEIKDHMGADMLPCQLYRSPSSQDVVEIGGSGWKFQMNTVPYLDIESVKEVTDEEPSGYIVTSEDELRKLTDKLTGNNMMCWIDISKDGKESKVIVLLFQPGYPELFGFFLPNAPKQRPTPKYLTPGVGGRAADQSATNEREQTAPRRYTRSIFGLIPWWIFTGDLQK